MKTIEEYYNQLETYNQVNEEPSITLSPFALKAAMKEIQLEALKEGMIRAGIIAHDTGLQYGDYDRDRDGRIVGNAAQLAISRAAESLDESFTT